MELIDYRFILVASIIYVILFIKRKKLSLKEYLKLHMSEDMLTIITVGKTNT